MSCVHLGNKVSTIACCGGNTIPIHQCLSTEQPLDYCIERRHKNKFAVPLKFNVGNNQVTSQLATCLDCPHAVQPIEPPPRKPDDMDNLAVQLWYERRLKRHTDTYGHFPTSAVVIDASRHGRGDAIIAAWIAEGAKQSNSPVFIHAKGDHAAILQMLNQTIVPPADPMVGLARAVHDDKKSGPVTPRMQVWIKAINLDIQPQQPKHNLTDKELDAGRQLAHDKIILFPQASTPTRQWVYWHELHSMIRKFGMSPLVICSHDPKFQSLEGYSPHLSWREIAAACIAAKAVVANDSCPAHLAGTLDTPTIAILGPTSDSVFAHYQSVRCVSCPKNVVQCAGCYFHYKYNPQHCAFGCVALSNISHERVFNELRQMV